MNQSSKIYVAGHTGLVGSALVRFLKNKGYTNLVLKTSGELDLRCQEAVNCFFAQEQPEYVFLAAGRVGGALVSNLYKAEFIYDNLMIAANCIHASYLYGVKKLINLVSSCVYPVSAPQPLKEEYLLSGPCEVINESLALAKLSAIKLCRYYNEQYGTNFISVIPTNVYGPGDNFNLETAYVIPALLRKFYLAKLLQQKNWAAIRSDCQRYALDRIFHEKFDQYDDIFLTVELAKRGITEHLVSLWGTGTPFREFLYVDDLAEALVYLMVNYNAYDIGECINIGSGVEISIHELVLLIKKVIGCDGEMYYEKGRVDGVSRRFLDISKMQRLGWQAPTSLVMGLTLLYEWYQNNIFFKQPNNVFFGQENSIR